MKKTKVYCIDGFYETNYTSRSVTEIKELYKKYHNLIPCMNCNNEPVETKMEIQDTYYPTFVITRKKYCFRCWLSIINS